METIFNNRRHASRRSTAGSVYQSTPFGTPPMPRQATNADPMRGYVPVNGISSSHNSSTCSGSSSWVLWRDEPNSLYRDPRARRGRICSALLAVAVFLVVLTVLAIAGLAVYMGALRIDTNKPELIFEGNVRVTSGDEFVPALSNNNSAVFKEMALKYQNMIDKVYQRSQLRPAYKKCEVEKFENGTLVVFFRLYLDRRKIPRSFLNVEETARDILVNELIAPRTAAFKNVQIDATSIFIKRCMDDIAETNNKKKLSDNRTLEMKNGVLRKATSDLTTEHIFVKNSSELISSSEISSSNSNETSKEVVSGVEQPVGEAVPVIAGSVVITKLLDSGSGTLAEKPNFSKVKSSTPFPLQDSEPINNTKPPNNSSTADKNSSVLFSMKPSSDLETTSTSTSTSTTVKNGMSSTAETFEDTDFYPIANPEKTVNQTSNQTMEDRISYEDEISVSGEITKEISGINQENHVLDQEISSEIATEVNGTNDPLIKRIGDKEVPLIGSNHTPNPLHFKTNSYNDRYQTAWNIKSSTPSYDFKPAFLQTDEPWRPILPYSKQSPKPVPHYEYDDVIGTGVAGVAEVIPIPPSAVENINVEQIDKLDNRYSSRIGQAADESNHRHQEDVPGVYGSLNVNTDLQDSQNNDTVSRVSLRVVGSGGLNNDETSVIHTTSGGGIIVRKPQPQPQPQPVTFHPPHTIPLTYTTTEPPSTRRSIANPFTVPELPILHQFRDVDAILKPPAIPGSKYHQDSNLDIKDTAIRPHYRDSAIGTGPVDVLPSQVHQADTFWSEQKNEKIGIRPHYNKPPSNVPFGMGYVLPAEEHPIQNSWNNRRNKNNTEPVYKETAIEIKSNSPITGTNIGFTSSENHQNQPFWVDMRKRNTSNENLKDDPTKTPSANPSLGFGSVSPIIEEPQWIELVNVTTSAVKPQKVKTQGTSLYSEPSINRYHRPVWGDVGYRGRPSYRDPSFTSVDSSSSKVHVNKTTRVEFNKVPTTTTPFPLITLMPVRSNSGVRPLRPRPKIPFHRNLTQTNLSLGHTSGILNSGESLFGTGIVGSGKNNESSHVHNQTEGNQNRTTFTSNRHQAVINSDSYSTTNMPPLIHSSKPSTNVSQPHGATYHIGTVKVESIEDYSNTYTTNNRTQYYTTTRPQTSLNINSYSPLMSSTTLKPFTTTISTFTTSRSKPRISTSTSIPTSTENTMPSLIKVILSSPPSVLSSLSSSLPTVSTSLPSSSSVSLSTEKTILPAKLTSPSTVKTTSLVTQSPTHTSTVKIKVTTKQTPVTTKANVQTTNHTVPTTELVTNATTSHLVKVTNVQTKSSTPATIVKITKMPTAPTTPPTVRVTTKITSLTPEKSTQLPTSSTTVKSVTSTSRVSAPLLSLNGSKTVTQSHKVEVFTKPPPSTTTYKVTTDSSFKKKVSNLSSLPEIKASSSNKTVFVTKDSASVEVMTSLAYVDLNKNSHKQQQDINKMASVQINNVTKIIENLMKNSPNMNLSNGTHNIKTKSNGTILHQNTTKIPESAAITEFVSKLPQVKPPSLTTTVPSITFTTTKLAPTSTVRSTSVKITTVKPQHTSASLIRQSTKPITTTVSSRKVSPGTEFNEYIPVAIIRDTSRDPVRYKNNAVHNLDNQQKLKPDKDKQNSTTESFREYKKENKISVEEVSTLAALSNKTVAQNGLQSNTTDKNTSRENTTHHVKSKQESIGQTKPEQGKQNNSAELYTDFKKEYKMDGFSPSEAPSTQNSTENITPSTQNSTKNIAQNIGKNTSVNNVTFKLTPSDLNNKKDVTKHEEYITTPESVTLTPGIVILSTDVVTTTSIILSYGENEEISESEPKTRDTSGTTTPKTEGLTEETTHKSNERIENSLKTNENNHTESISVINSTNPVTVSTVVSSTSVSSTTKTKESRRQPKMKPHLPEVENYMSSKPIFSHASSVSDEIIVRQSLSTQVSDDSMPEVSENDKNETNHVVVTISKYEPINYNYSVTFDVPSTLLHKLNDTFTKDTDSSDKFTENISMEVMKTTILPYEETASENMLTTITEQETKASTLPTFLETLSDEEVYSTKLNNLLTTLVDQGITTSEDATTEKTLTTKSESNFPISEDYFNTESEEITNIISETVGTYTNFSVTKVSVPGKVESTQLSDDEVLRLLTFENSTNNHIRNQSIMTQEAMDELSKYANIHKNQPPSTADATDVETTTATYIGDNITKPEYHEEKLSTKAVSSLSNTNHAAIPILTKIYNKVPQHSEEKPSWKATTSDGISSELANETACPSNMSLRCGDGECISALSRCNQLVDCSDGADERDCTCADYLKAQFLTRKLCDGIVDCWDFSDENNCEWCTPGQFVCPNSQVCVDQHRLCDGSRDCPYGDDEKQCVTVAQNEVQAGDFPYSSEGYLMVRKQGRWGKLCLQNFNKVVERSQSSWEVSDLGRAVCKAMTYSDFDRVNRTIDSPTDSRADDSHYFELAYSSDTNGNTSQPRSSLSFQETECTQKEVVHVSCRDLECGVRPQAVNQWARIVGGGNAAPGAWPWQAALYKEGEFQCGATLIADRWLVSAGHCFYHALDDYWVARLGALRRGSSFPSPYEQLRPVSHIILHPGYVDAGFLNDISLLRLREPVQFSDFVRPVCLPTPPPAASIRDGRLCTVVGWGQLFEVGRIFPDTLQEVQLPIISTAECRKRTLFLPLYRVTDNMFCAGFDRGGRDACLGDSGGPLMCQEKDGRWSLYGVTSNGYGCARANRPGVYTKVANYVPWLQAAMAQQVSSLRDSKTQCKGHRCPLGECLPPTRICNGFMECSDGSDEKNCW